MGHLVNYGEVAVVEGLGKRVLENGSGSINPPKFKKRKVSAIRDFPKGCGRFAGNGVVVRSEEENIRRRDLVDELEESSSVVNQPVEFKTLEMAVGLVQKESLELPKSLIHEPAMPNLAQAEGLEPMKSSEHMIVDALPLQSIPPDEVVEGLDNLQTSVTVDAVAENMRKKYPPRRSVSACRDFPPGCGRNAAPINIKEFQELIKPSKNESVVDEKKDKIVKTDPKHSEEEVQVGDAPKSNMKHIITKKIGDGAQVKAEAAVKKGTVEQIHVKDLSKCASKKEHTNETIIKTPRENLMSQSDSRPPSFNKKVGKGSGGSGEKLGMESVKLNKGVSSQRKLPGNSINESRVVSQSQGREYVGLAACDDRVVVQALMVEPNCPWSQAKKNSQPATGNQSQVGQGNKTLKSASKTFKSASGNQSQLQVVKYVGSQSSDNREIVQSLMAAPNCPWRQGSKWSSKGKKKQAFLRK
ncbi:hypothetical protein AQUCO_03800082v1 [Aquilegia coerulea]|uniref:Uncharacterized protein n=1 Tax=Aquilegia coerulea TaxID=218851 RepID=A0A2G5CSJ3_AQUCA|nr:hypothetical protein AQUCO_03800082v1 [Aquilegia coerulea]